MTSPRAALQPQTVRPHYNSPTTYKRTLTRSPPPPAARSTRTLQPAVSQTPLTTPRTITSQPSLTSPGTTFGGASRTLQKTARSPNNSLIDLARKLAPQYTAPKNGSFVAPGYSQIGAINGGYTPSGSFVAPALTRGMQVRPPTSSIQRSLSPTMQASYTQLGRTSYTSLRGATSFRH